MYFWTKHVFLKNVKTAHVICRVTGRRKQSTKSNHPDPITRDYDI